jgi:hypothetical protein
LSAMSPPQVKHRTGMSISSAFVIDFKLIKTITVWHNLKQRCLLTNTLPSLSLYEFLVI